MFRLFRPSLLAVLLLLGLTSSLRATQGVIITNDGRYIVGDIDDTGGDIVNITVHGIATGFQRIGIASIEYNDNILREFNDRLGKLPDADVKGRMDLAQWALDRHQYDLARQAALAAQKVAPENSDIDKLLDTIQSQQTLDAKNESAARTALEPPKNPVGPPATAPAGAPQRYLADDDINLIRQSELRSTDVVRVNFLNNVRDRYLATQGTDAATFNNLTPTGQAVAIISAGDPALARDVKIISDPQALLVFRNQIEPRLLMGCAASGCHGGSSDTSFFLYSNAASTQAWYTNFFILSTFRTKVIVSDLFGKGPAMRPLIDRFHANNSPLAQYSLPANLVANPHPTVTGWKPVFYTQQDPGYAQLIDWMGGMLKPVVDENYGIQFDLPTMSAASRPSEAPGDSAAAATAPASTSAPTDNVPPASAPDISPSMLNK
jgi:hypothetical protein